MPECNKAVLLQLLEKLLKSQRTDDLQAANLLIKSTIKEVSWESANRGETGHIVTASQTISCHGISTEETQADTPQENRQCMRRTCLSTSHPNRRRTDWRR